MLTVTSFRDAHAAQDLSWGSRGRSCSLGGGKAKGETGRRAEEVSTPENSPDCSWSGAKGLMRQHISKREAEEEAEEERLRKQEEAAEAKRRRELERSKKAAEVDSNSSISGSPDAGQDCKGDTDTLPATPVAERASQ